MRTLPRSLGPLALALALSGCGSSETSPAEREPSSEPPAATAPEAPATPPAPAPSAAETERRDDACARVVVVAYAGAAYAPEGVTRSRDEARERATQLRARIAGGEDFATLARAESDANTSGPRGGLLGTYERHEWPPAHEAIQEPVWALEEGALSDVLEAPYGFVLAQRCPVERVHTRHILVRYAGARNAPSDITRSREEAESRARELLTRARAEGADFAAIAAETSEDGSAERGGDVGAAGRGRLAPAYEAAAFALAPGAISDVVESDFGFHIIQRMTN